VAQRALEAAERFHLEVLRAVALTFLAHTHGLLGERAMFEETAKRAMPVLQEHPDLLAELWGSRASASLIEDDIARAWQELLAGREAGPLPTTPGPRWGLHALLATFRNEGGEAACTALRGSPALIQPINRLLLAYADAIRLGREGQAQPAEAAVAAAEVILSRGSWYRNYGRRLVAEAAIAAGWGEPAVWLAESGAFFEQHGQQAAASTCRSLLRKAGGSSAAARPHPEVRPDLRTAGVTEREEEVLRLVAEGLSNKEIGERLYISARTAERHVFSLMNKLGLRTRAQLAAALAAGPR
jgi:DNA-binding CsgD family transcriptional regulator